MTDRDLDRRAAEMMGWRASAYPFSPTTSASDDYRVLSWVRETWKLRAARFWYH